MEKSSNVSISVSCLSPIALSKGTILSKNADFSQKLLTLAKLRGSSN